MFTSAVLDSGAGAAARHNWMPKTLEWVTLVAWYPCYYARMIRKLSSSGNENLIDGKDSKPARKACPRDLWTVVTRKLDQLDSAECLEDLKIPPGNRLEALAGNREGQHSIRINNQYRICFHWTESGPDSVEIVDYH